MKIIRCLVSLRVHDRVVAIDHGHQAVRVGVEMQVTDHRRQHLRDVGPAARAQPGLHEFDRSVQHRLDQDPDRRFIRG